MQWKEIGGWLKNNAGSGATLVGSLLTGNLPAAVAAGVSLVSAATGTDNPENALVQLQTNPETIVKLKELALREEDGIREHIRAMTELELKDRQAEHHETQKTVRAGDMAQDRFVRWTRPGQSWISLFFAGTYVFTEPDPDFTILGLLLTLPWAYAGLRQVGKGIDAFVTKESQNDTGRSK